MSRRAGGPSRDAGGGERGFTPPRDFAHALELLHARTDVEASRPESLDQKRVFRLDRMRALAASLGDPHKSFRVVHVAGSKGKGSVCEMTAAALAGCGCTVGLYTSPHLIDERERIRISGRWITQEEFTATASRVLEAAHTLDRALGECTTFELLTMIAFAYFAEQAVDVAAIEVGLGGLLDATNIVEPTVCVITAIQLEHRQILGKTLPEIARHKAGIIKPGIPVITLEQPPDVMAVFREVAEQHHAPLHVVGSEMDFSFRFESTPELGPHFRVSLGTPTGVFEHVPVPLKGDHQAWNCALTLGVIDRLRALGMPLGEAQVVEGLARTQAPGRLELIHKEPRVYIDGAHNPESVAALVKALGAHLRYDSLVVVFGCASDKDIPAMLTNIGMGADKIIFTQAEGSARGVEPRELQRRYQEVTGKSSQVAPTVKDAVNLAARAVGRGDIILVTGSFRIAGEAKKLFEDKARRQGQVEVRDAGAREKGKVGGEL